MGHSFLSYNSLEMVKTHQLSCDKLYSATIHPSKECFVVGGEDFKLYKFGYENGQEMGEKQ